MDNKKMNEKESLELISQMIQNAKAEMADRSGTPFLIWGYMTMTLSLLVWFLLQKTGNSYWQCLWFLLPSVAYPLTFWFNRKQGKTVKTFIDRILKYVWLVFGLSGLVISCVSFINWKLPILFVILLMMGMGTALTGLIVNMRVTTVCGALGILSSVACLYAKGTDQLLLFALAFFLMMVIPGHVMNRETARNSELKKQ